MKPAFQIDLSPLAPSPLAAHRWLECPAIAPTHHRRAGFREPLGIYNTSISRISSRVHQLCQALDAYFRLGKLALAPSSAHSAELTAVTDYLELALYAAAEHVDDLDAIACGYFDSPRIAAQSRAYRALKNNVKPAKKLLLTAANSIKHQQARIRIYSLAYQHGPHSGIFHGYFIEGVEDGEIGPSGELHKEQAVFSVTALSWEVLWFALKCSEHLATFLQAVLRGPAVTASPCPGFTKAVGAAARLPNYTFGESHPFERHTFIVTGQEASDARSPPALYGTCRLPWDREAPLTFGSSCSSFEGDGSSRSFKLVAPTKVVLHHWE